VRPIKNKRRIEAYLKKHPLVEEFHYERGEWEDPELDYDLVQAERVWVYLRKGFFFASSDVSQEYMYTLGMVLEDFRHVFYYHEDELIFWEPERQERHEQWLKEQANESQERR
jgi:hypothetical protein